MLWGAGLQCFIRFLWYDEVCTSSVRAFDDGAHLSVTDIQVDNLTNPSPLQIEIKASKTYSFQKVTMVAAGGTHKSIFPVSVILSVMVIRQNKSGSLFKF